MEDLQVGQLVRSRAGRDRGNYYLIYDVLDEAFVRVIDGEKKRLTNPKRKNIKHLEALSVPERELADRLRDGKAVTDDEVIKIIRSLG
ncbi:MAG TPA: KOW domain-containing RNA-binding protein [Desulfobacteria bacterium]|nr:KOW domain-containing RNA-binding protein [Desulfobacteria bacterium]